MEKLTEFLRVDFYRAGADDLVLGFSVEDAGNAAGATHGLDGGAARAGALRDLKGYSFGHKTENIRVKLSRALERNYFPRSSILEMVVHSIISRARQYLLKPDWV